MKVWNGAKVIDIFFTGITVPILGPILTTLLWLNAYVFNLKPLPGHMLFGPGINSAREKTN